MGFHCPFTSKAITERSTENGCDNTYRYHCMRTKQGSLTEQCLEISWIQDGKCAIYNADAKRVDAESCNENLGICPQKQYLSNDVTSYSACVNVPEISSFVPTRHVASATIPSITSKLPSDGSQANDGTNMPWVWVIGLVVAAVSFVVAIVVIVRFVVYNRRKRSSPDTSDGCAEEERKPLQLSSRDQKNSFRTEGKKDQRDTSDGCAEEERKPLQLSSRDQKNSFRTEGKKDQRDQDEYYKTRAFEHLASLIEDSAESIVIVGKPGSGKSVLAEMLYRRFRWVNEKGGKCYQARLLESLQRTENYPRYENYKMIFIIDDCFEDWNQYPHLVSTSLAQLQRVHDSLVNDQGNCLVLTISKNNFESNLDKVQKLQLKGLNIVDLSSDKFSLDITDKTGILENQRKKKGFAKARMEDKNIRNVTDPGVIRRIASYLVKSDLEFEYPLSCNLFYLHDAFEDKQEEFFIKTDKIIVDFVKRLGEGTEEEKCKYCTLMYVVLNGGQVQALKKQRKSLLEDIAKEKGMDTSGSKIEFDYECCLITEGKGKTYKIVHEEITKLLFSSFGYVHTGLVITKCDLGVLLKFLRTDDTKRRKGYREKRLLVITNNKYELLAVRFQDTYKTYEKHVIFQDEKFREKFK